VSWSGVHELALLVPVEVVDEALLFDEPHAAASRTSNAARAATPSRLTRPRS
jgi:hypothetical protein